MSDPVMTVEEWRDALGDVAAPLTEPDDSLGRLVTARDLYAQTGGEVWDTVRLPAWSAAHPALTIEPAERRGPQTGFLRVRFNVGPGCPSVVVHPDEVLEVGSRG